MRTRTARGFRLGLAGLLVAAVGPAGHAGEPAAPAPVANPFANPYLNPYLNPTMTAQPMTPEASLLYLMAAQRATGGIGSGRISGVRPGPGPAAVPKGAEGRPGSPRGATRREPAGAAAGYFYRGYSATRPQRPTNFGRNNRYFPDDGR
jgi:hypothetical protein